MHDTAQKYEFQTEARQLLDLMIHSVYSNRDIFLREIVSNASDALDKLRIEALRNDTLAMPQEPTIRIEADRVARTLSVVDNGIGMNRDELVANIGTIAKSGTKEFLDALRASKDSSSGAAELIGQFGVGFYSTFMVADRVTLLTRRVGEDRAWLWESTGDGTYSIEEAERPTHGTTVTLHMKPADEDEDAKDYLDEWTIRSIVKRYSDFVTYPIRMRVERQEQPRDADGKPIEGAAPETVVTDETLNSMKALWTRSKEQVTQEEYNEFYHHISHDWHDPLLTYTVRAEGTFEYYALLFIPSHAPTDLFFHEKTHGLQLYVKRVFILDEAKDLLPTYLRFVKGVVDSEDLPLNISREILQENRQIRMIRGRIARKTIETLAEMLRTDRETYLTFWKEFGAVLKEGIFQDFENRDAILDLALFASTNGANGAGSTLTTLGEYVGRMKEGQDAIYFITGDNRDVLLKSPHLEAFLAKGYEVLLLSDPVDEIWAGNDIEYQGRKLRSVARGTVELGSEAERRIEEEKLAEGRKEFGEVLSAIQEHLKDHVSEVRLSTRLTSSAVCLVSGEHDMSPQMAKLFRAMGQAAPQTKRIMELNAEHPLLRTLQSIVASGGEGGKLGQYAELLYGQALLAEGAVPEDPVRFSRLVADLMVGNG
jgi:molecular chaperone HtpG